jgi:polyisoprenoid-binding protein YceI
MRYRHVARTALSCAVGLVITVAAAYAQDAERRPLTLASGQLTIAGTSNVHDYTAKTTTIRLTRVKLAAGVAAASLWDEIVKPGTLQAFEIAIPAATLTSPKEGLDKNMHKALKAQEHAEITFRLVRLEPAGAPGAGTFRGVGVLKIAGVEREVVLALTTGRKDGGLLVKGELGLLMTDFGITPPKAMLGMLKTDPKVTITFETLLAVPQT